MINDGLDDEFEKSLGEDIRKAYEEVAAFYAELEGESARAAAILVVAQIDQELTKVISRYFPADIDKKIWKKLIGPNAPIGNLGNKCLMAEALGAFGPRTRKTIDTMAQIRNKFAHDTGVRKFKHQGVLTHCKSLGDNPVYKYDLIDTASEREIRSYFITTARCLHQRLEMIAPGVSGLGDPHGPLP